MSAETRDPIWWALLPSFLSNDSRGAESPSGIVKAGKTCRERQETSSVIIPPEGVVFDGGAACASAKVLLPRKKRMPITMRTIERLIIPFFVSVHPLQERTAPPMVDARTTLFDYYRRASPVASQIFTAFNYGGHSRVNCALSFSSPLPPPSAVILQAQYKRNGFGHGRDCC